MIKDISLALCFGIAKGIIGALLLGVAVTFPLMPYDNLPRGFAADIAGTVVDPSGPIVPKATTAADPRPYRLGVSRTLKNAGKTGRRFSQSSDYPFKRPIPPREGM